MTIAGPYIDGPTVHTNQTVTGMKAWYIGNTPSSGTTLTEFLPRDTTPFIQFPPEDHSPVNIGWYDNMYFSSVYDGVIDQCEANYILMQIARANNPVGPSSFPPGAVGYEFEPPGVATDEFLRFQVGWQANVSFGIQYEAGDRGYGGVWDGGKVLRVPAMYFDYDIPTDTYPELSRADLNALDVLQDLQAETDGELQDPIFHLIDVTVPDRDGIAIISNSGLSGTAAYRGPAIGGNQTAEDAWISYAGYFISPEDKPGNTESRDHARLRGSYVSPRYRFLYEEPITGANLHPLRQRQLLW